MPKDEPPVPASVAFDMVIPPLPTPDRKPVTHCLDCGEEPLTAVERFALETLLAYCQLTHPANVRVLRDWLRRRGE